MKKIYLAAPLFNEMEIERNVKIKEWLKEIGFDVFLPQEDSGIAYDILKNNNKQKVYKNIFECDVQGIKSSDILLFLLDGRVPDEGACVELGMAFAWNIPCIGYKTDTRALDITGDDNLMINGCFKFEIANNLKDLKNILNKIKTRLN